MKKSVKALIVAASVAAVVGVGAVSFAKWQASNVTDNVTITGTTGEIATLGNITVTPADSTYTTTEGGAIVMNNLYPVDQDNAPTGGLTYWTFTIESDVTGTQSVEYKLEGSLTAGNNEPAITAAKLYWTKTDPTTKTLTAADGTEVVSSGAGTALTGVANGDTIYVYMIASGTDAMNASISLKFIQAEPAATE